MLQSKPVRPEASVPLITVTSLVSKQLTDKVTRPLSYLLTESPFTACSDYLPLQQQRPLMI